ncbi:glyoxylase-like metal-dependent hydrolase (beta-lactamase superfamily II) [Allocatelliglobosispora scoriae]|uniref:Glyoxylase-like metal-dependent hydrolase (Beta-lactamase superfamily II) n=1 Tax=Allocatelliglobosispora scoriae TaxID=643052 RepID=A0A841BPC8_9ACTN|nr:MBL fold metallo-hydrolase [Allocatelliglobosispora scoriae]MBB5868803.1 glyoxylase-like metal-dependent hydrolase (beta-lactamase superfamily II) [Allocatelliglobosispora scoriae]
MTYPQGLHAIAPETFAYLQPPGTWGWNNCGLVVDGSQALLVDTAYTLGLTRELLGSVAAALPGVEIGTLVFTHGNGDHCNGNQLLAGAEMICSAATADELPHEISPAQMTAMMQLPAQTPVGGYMRRYFADFDWSGIEPTPPTRTFAGRLTIPVGAREVELIEAGPAHTDGDVFVHVPDAGVVFTGDLLFIGDHPVMWSGPVEGWVGACDQLLGTGATIFVPGHGPVADRAGVAAFRGYLEQVGVWAEKQIAAGVAYDVAARTFPVDGFERWGLRERLIVTMGSIYAGHGLPSAERPALIGGMSVWGQELAAAES